MHVLSRLIQRLPRFDVILLIRWLALLHILFIALSGLSIGSLNVLLVLIAYNLLLSWFLPTLADDRSRITSLLIVDVLISITAIWFTGSNWNSPYFVYAFTSLMLAGSLSSLRVSLGITSLFSALYAVSLAGIAVNLPHVLAENIDTLIGNFAAFFLTTCVFGYPAFLIKETEESLLRANQMKETANLAFTLVQNLEQQPVFTLREQEVLELMCSGQTNKEISGTLTLSEKTIKNHVSNIYRKCGVSSRTELIVFITNRKML